jgi:hypothetical protein
MLKDRVEKFLQDNKYFTELEMQQALRLEANFCQMLLCQMESCGQIKGAVSEASDNLCGGCSSSCNSCPVANLKIWMVC